MTLLKTEHPEWNKEDCHKRLITFSFREEFINIEALCIVKTVAAVSTNRRSRSSRRNQQLAEDANRITSALEWHAVSSLHRKSKLQVNTIYTSNGLGFTLAKMSFFKPHQAKRWCFRGLDKRVLISHHPNSREQTSYVHALQWLGCHGTLCLPFC